MYYDREPLQGLVRVHTMILITYGRQKEIKRSKRPLSVYIRSTCSYLHRFVFSVIHESSLTYKVEIGEPKVIGMFRCCTTCKKYSFILYVFVVHCVNTILTFCQYVGMPCFLRRRLWRLNHQFISGHLDQKKESNLHLIPLWNIRDIGWIVILYSKCIVFVMECTVKEI